MKEKVRSLKRRIKASKRRQKYLKQKRRQKRKDYRFISQLIADAQGTLDDDYRKRDKTMTDIRVYPEEEYKMIERLIYEINRRGKNCPDPIEIILNYPGGKKNQVYCKYIDGPRKHIDE